MSVPNITRIKTSLGEAQIDYDALANLPDIYEKEEVLSASTKTILGLDSAANPDAAFEAIKQMLDSKVGEEEVGDITENIISQQSYTKDEILTVETISMFGLNENSKPDAVFQKLAMPYGYYGFDVTTVFSNGKVAPHIILNGLQDFYGNTVKTDSNGRCKIAVSESSTPTVTISGYLDVVDTSVVLSSQEGIVFTPVQITIDANTDTQTFSTSTTKMVTGATVFDFTAVGGGGGGTCSRWGSEYGGAGGGGGYIKSATNISLPNSTISFTIGSGGVSGYKSSDADEGSAYGGSGGESSVKKSDGSTIVSANGGSGASKGTGGAGNGKGGNVNSVGEDASGYLFDDSSLGVPGGGGGGGGNDKTGTGTPISGGTPYGGTGSYSVYNTTEGGYNNYNATSGSGYGGGGGGGAQTNYGNSSAAGAAGAVFVRARFV